MTGEKNTNLESIEKVPVVRIFFLQPVDPNQINDLTDLKKISLTEVVLVRKNKFSKNAGALMPVGGSVLPHEDVNHAAIRESLEETHLIFTELVKMQSEQTYYFKHGGKLVGRKSYFFVGRLFAPKYDVPYALDNDVDKIEKFVRLNRQELKELIDGDKVKGGYIYDSLSANKEARKRVGTIASQKEIHAVQNELSEKLMQAEVDRKLNVLKILFKKKLEQGELDTGMREKFSILEKDISNDAIKILDKYKIISKYWEKNINLLVNGPEDLIVALRFSNLEDILADLVEYKKKEGDTLPTLQMMFPIMFGLNFDVRFLDLIKRNVHLEKIYTMSRILFLYNNMQTGQRGAASERLLRRLLQKQNGRIEENDLTTYFKKLGILSQDFQTNFKALADEVDLFFQDLQKQSQISPTVASLSHINEVEDKPFERIVKLAFSSEERQIKFEAQRKLLLVYLSFQARSFYNNVVGKGITELDDLEKKMEVKTVGQNSLKDKKRRISLGGKEYPVIIERRRKEFNSMLRKVLVRDALDFKEDSPYNDIFGETYVFDDAAIEEMNEDLRPVPLPMTDGKDRKIEKYSAPLVVHIFLQELKTKLGIGEKIEILQFKGLPKEGEGALSNSIGGGAKVRFLKFYIRHTDTEGVERTREVQMFLPKKENGEIVSGEVDYTNKKIDDDRYALARLFTHGNVYSVIELLFPHHVYGDSMKDFFKIKK